MFGRFLIVYLLLCAFSAKAKNVQYRDNVPEYKLDSCVYLFVDSSGTLPFNDVTSGSWKLLTDKANFGFIDATLWFRVTLENQDSTSDDLLFSIPFPNLNYIDYYEVTDGKITNSAKVGELLPFSNRPVKHRYFLFEARLLPKQSKVFYFRVMNNGDSIHFPLELYSKNAFIESDFTSVLLLGGYFGIIIIILIFNIFYFNFRTRDNIYYLCYVFFTMLFFYMIEGYGAQFYNGHALYWQEISTILFVAFINVCFLRFTRKFLSITRQTGRIIYAFYFFEIFNIVLVPFIILGYPLLLFGIIGVSISIVASFLFNLYVCIIRYRQKAQQSEYFLASAVFGLTGVLIYFFRDINVINDTIVSSNVLKISFITEAIILWLAVLHRFKQDQKCVQDLLEQQQDQIQKQNQALELANRELEKLSIVASETDNSVAIFSANGELEWINIAFEKIHGTSLRRLLKIQKNTISSIYKDIDITSFNANQSQDPIIFELRIDRSEQKAVWVNTTITPFFDKDGVLQKIIVIDSDITDLKILNQELNLAKEKAEEANRLKTNFLSNISHELRTPLNAIIGFSQLLITKNYECEKQKEFLKLINSNGNHLLELICDIIDVSRIESGSYVNQPIHFNLNVFLREIHQNFEQQLSNIRQQYVKCELTCGLADSRALVYYDQLKLRQVLINIMGNAMKFTQRGAIVIGYTPMKTDSGMKLEFWVEDTGVGIPEDKLDVVFQRFRQANEQQDRPFNGAGLGLTISKGLIEVMGGEISILSQQNKGTRVSFLLPFSDVAVKEVSLTAVEDNSSSDIVLTGKKIMIVEDEYSNFEVLHETLIDSGATFVHATTGAQALKMYDQTVSIVLLDIKLPDISGIDVAKRLREINPAVKIVFQTAFALRETRDECLAVGCVDFFTKPIEPHLIISSLRRHIADK